MTARVALAEDHELVRKRLRRILEDEPRIELVAEARDGREVLRAALELAPDVVLMDIRMPHLNGIEATRAICASAQGVKVLVISLHCDSELAQQALDAGASGVMLKEEAHELVKATLAVAAGEMYLSEKISALLKERPARRPERDGAKARLSEGERHVLLLLAAKTSSQEIACRLQVNGEVLDAHRRRIIEKLSLHGASDLARLVEGEAGA